MRSAKRGRKGLGQRDESESIEDLIVLERYEEAEGRLAAKVKADPKDLHAHLRLAEVYIQLRQGPKAAAEYTFVAEEYARDGFYDKGIALLAKAAKVDPFDDSIQLKIEALSTAKRLEHKRHLALQGFEEARGNHLGCGVSAVDFQRFWPKFAHGPAVRQLPGDQLRQLLSAVIPVRRVKESVLARQGSPEGALVMIAEGVVEAKTRLPDGRNASVRSFSSGDLIGEAVLLEKKAWPADYSVTEDAILLVLNRKGLERSLQGCADPRRFLDALREQQNDREVALAVQRLRAKT